MNARKTVAIIQSCYIPWKGYFDLINAADEFMVYDDVQYTTNDWRNRNRIKTPHGTQWLTIPIRHSSRHGQRVDEAQVADPRWAERHWRTLAQSYARAPWFHRYRDELEALYRGAADEPFLSRVNRLFTDAVCRNLGITTTITSSADYGIPGDGSERVLALCRASGAARYLSGPRARAYLDEAAFSDAGIKIAYMDYDGYPEYPQVHPPFDHHVTALDLLFNSGPDAPRYLKSFVDVTAATA